jgi:hypothetical protein
MVPPASIARTLGRRSSSLERESIRETPTGIEAT